MEKVVNDSIILEEKYRNSLKHILFKYKHVFSDCPGKVNNYDHIIHLHDKTPIQQKSYPVPYKLKGGYKWIKILIV